ncbi:putative oxidoreductase [Helianthus debilis subsp. tardiflorus]
MTLKTMAHDMFAAGSDTSSVTVEWAMSELMKNPRVIKKAQDELRHVLNEKTKIYESDMQELDYLKQVIKETLRLHPPLPFLLPRECRDDCEIGGFHITIKTKVIINAWMIGRDPDYWIDPESFVLERFSESTLNIMGTNFEYLPFGAGRRMCPGMLLGLANVELLLNYSIHFYIFSV